jgi:hypothetical protein
LKRTAICSNAWRVSGSDTVFEERVLVEKSVAAQLDISSPAAIAAQALTIL